GLKFGIYEDAGSKTCGGFAGSGAPKGGGKPHFAQDAKLFAKWGVDYLKLDGCNVYVPKGSTVVAAYRKAYAAESAALKASGRPIVFLESAPAYFQGKPAWYDVLSWVGQYGQLWREGSDIQTFHPSHPSASRFHSVLWNYAYNLPLGRYQSPGHWNDPDFIIGGDGGMSLAETRSQLALWAMMSAPLVLSVDVAKLSPAAIRVLGSKAVIRVDQDPLGRMATLVRRTPTSDLLLKPLAGGDYAVAVLNHGDAPIQVDLPLDSLGFSTGKTCTMSVRNLWTNATSQHQQRLKAKIEPNDTIIWRLRPAPACAAPARTGAIVMTLPGSYRVPGSREIDHYGRCLTDTGVVHRCQGNASERWTVSANGTLRAGKRCLAVANGAPKMQPCSNKPAQQWTYRLKGNLVNKADHLCLGVRGAGDKPLPWRMQPCGHNLATQIWALPN
ncbi:MAG: ricin-type beta-trefoil lectin domain protein, partial [Gammaproteobacteria bacterium]